MRKALIEGARVLWMEGGKGKERPLWIEAGNERLLVSDWMGEKYPNSRRFIIKANGWNFEILERKGKSWVYFLPEELFPENHRFFLNLHPEGQVILEVNLSVLLIFGAGPDPEVLLWTQGHPVIYSYNSERRSLPWRTRELEGKFWENQLTLNLSLPPYTPFFLFLRVGPNSSGPEFLAENPFSYTVFYPKL